MGVPPPPRACSSCNAWCFVYQKNLLPEKYHLVGLSLPNLCFLEVEKAASRNALVLLAWRFMIGYFSEWPTSWLLLLFTLQLNFVVVSRANPCMDFPTSIFTSLEFEGMYFLDRYDIHKVNPSFPISLLMSVTTGLPRAGKDEIHQIVRSTLQSAHSAMKFNVFRS